MWCVAELDEEYIVRMEDVLAVYEKPLSEQEPVVCVDEKPVVLHQELRPPLALKPGWVARRDSEYQRWGTANVFCGVEPKAGRHFTKVTARRSAPEFADYLLHIAARYPQADTIHLVMDNLSSHTCKSVVERFGEQAGSWLWNRFTVHYTPKHGSWLNQAEIAISLFSRQCLGKHRIADRASLRKETRAWNRRMDRDHVLIQWEFTRKTARNTFGYTITRSRYWRTVTHVFGPTRALPKDGDLKLSLYVSSRSTSAGRGPSGGFRDCRNSDMLLSLEAVPEGWPRPRPQCTSSVSL